MITLGKTFESHHQDFVAEAEPVPAALSIRRLLVIAAIAQSVISCSSEMPSPEVVVCRPEAARRLVARPTDDEIRFLTKASIVRRIKPGDSVTEDFREDRITVITDSTGKVISAKCG